MIYDFMGTYLADVHDFIMLHRFSSLKVKLCAMSVYKKIVLKLKNAFYDPVPFTH